MSDKPLIDSDKAKELLFADPETRKRFEEDPEWSTADEINISVVNGSEVANALSALRLHIINALSEATDGGEKLEAALREEAERVGTEVTPEIRKKVALMKVVLMTKAFERLMKAIGITMDVIDDPIVRVAAMMDIAEDGKDAALLAEIIVEEGKE